MSNQFRSDKHLEWVRQHPCMICGSPDVQAHHLLKPWQGYRGTGMKAGDQNTVPLCHKHHHQLHMRGDEMEYFRSVTGERDTGKTKAMELWFKSPAYRRV